MITVRRAGLRLRLITGFVLVAVLSSLTASGIAYYLLQRSIMERVQTNAIEDFKNALGQSIPPDMPRFDYDFGSRAAVEFASQLKSVLSVQGRHDVKLAEVRDNNVRFFPDIDVRYGVEIPRDFATAARNNTVYRRVEHRGAPYLLVGAQVYAQSDQGAFRTTPIMGFVIVSLSREAADLSTLTTALVVANAVTLAVAVVIALFAARRVLEPVRRLGRAARDLGDGQLDTRADVVGDDELADLARTFNRTAGALEDSIAELRAMEASSRRFVADVSHELRTPLTAVTALADTLADENISAADRDRAGSLVTEGIWRLRNLVEHLIEISRHDSGTATLVPDDVKVAEAVAACLAARGWTGQVEVEGADDLMARLDPRRFDVILANLVGNALRHGAPPVRVRWEPETVEGVPGMTLTVTDHGPGIPTWLLPLVFDRLVKLDRARASSEGSGLGLSIARANAELHGGTVTAANPLSGGTVFTVWLPLEGQE
ncbi:ATP-binding protein [Streptosporangium sp. NPDC000396]|uniref:ATP-binding protein n=1 Tax=Streptosporangium sp. NPDC000396 TaxID=3366185 RepID=UPI003694874B